MRFVECGWTDHGAIRNGFWVQLSAPDIPARVLWYLRSCTVCLFMPTWAIRNWNVVACLFPDLISFDLNDAFLTSISVSEVMSARTCRVSDQGSFEDLMQSDLQRAKNQEAGKTNDSWKSPAKETVHGSAAELTSEHYTSGLSPLLPPQAAHSNDLSSYCTNKHNSHHSLPGHPSHDVDTMLSVERNSLGKV